MIDIYSKNENEIQQNIKLRKINMVEAIALFWLFDNEERKDLELENFALKLKLLAESKDKIKRVSVMIDNSSENKCYHCGFSVANQPEPLYIVLSKKKFLRLIHDLGIDENLVKYKNFPKQDCKCAIF